MKPEVTRQAATYVDSWLALRQQQHPHEMPGLVVAIQHKGKLVLHKAYGYANLQQQTPMTTAHLFRIASHSKTFAATAIMQLAEQKKLHIDDPATAYLTWLRSHKDKRMANVTIRQLLSHGAGIIRDGLNADFWELRRPFPSKNQFRKAILEANLVFKNNTKLKYSNFGYGLLGEIVEVVASQPWETHITEHIIKPLQLPHTGAAYTPKMAPQLATPYARSDNNQTPQPFPHVDTRALGAAAGMYSTPADLCAYFAAHAIGSGKLLTDKSKKEMQQEMWRYQNSHKDAGYGLGMATWRIGDRRTIGHGGALQGFMTQTAFDTQDDLVVSVGVNSIAASADDIVEGIYSILDTFQKYGAASKNLEHFTGRYYSLWCISDIVPFKHTVLAANPMSGRPFKQAEELERTSPTTLKVAKASSIASEGEEVEFVFGTNNTPQRLTYAGITMVPKKAHMRRRSFDRQ